MIKLPEESLVKINNEKAREQINMLPVGTRVEFNGRSGTVTNLPLRSDLNSGKYSKEQVDMYLNNKKLSKEKIKTISMDKQ